MFGQPIGRVVGRTLEAPDAAATHEPAQVETRAADHAADGHPAPPAAEDVFSQAHQKASAAIAHRMALDVAQDPLLDAARRFDAVAAPQLSPLVRARIAQEMAAQNARNAHAEKHAEVLPRAEAVAPIYDEEHGGAEREAEEEQEHGEPDERGGEGEGEGGRGDQADAHRNDGVAARAGGPQEHAGRAQESPARESRDATRAPATLGDGASSAVRRRGAAGELHEAKRLPVTLGDGAFSAVPDHGAAGQRREAPRVPGEIARAHARIHAVGRPAGPAVGTAGSGRELGGTAQGRTAGLGGALAPRVHAGSPATAPAEARVRAAGPDRGGGREAASVAIPARARRSRSSPVGVARSGSSAHRPALGARPAGSRGSRPVGAPGAVAVRAMLRARGPDHRSRPELPAVGATSYPAVRSTPPARGAEVRPDAPPPERESINDTTASGSPGGLVAHRGPARPAGLRGEQRFSALPAQPERWPSDAEFAAEPTSPAQPAGSIIERRRREFGLSLEGATEPLLPAGACLPALPDAPTDPLGTQAWAPSGSLEAELLRAWKDALDDDGGAAPARPATKPSDDWPDLEG